MARDRKIAIVTVHGTGDTADSPDGQKWFQRGSAFTERLRQKLASEGLDAEIEPVLWSGANSAAEREKGAEKLARELKGLSGKYDSVHVIGHSHGGNVANEAAVHLRWGMRRRGKEPFASLTTVGTPFLNMRTGFLQRMAGLLFLGLTWGSVIMLPLAILGWQLEENRPPNAIEWGVLGFAAACLLFMMSMSQRGARRILRPSKPRQTDKAVQAIWHDNDEAISFLRRIEEVPIEAIPRGALFRGSHASAISWGVLVVMIVTFGIPFAYLAFPGWDPFGIRDAEWDGGGASALSFAVALVFAPATFVICYAIYRYLVGGAAEVGARGPINGYVTGLLRGVALGRDGDQVICNVSTESHTHRTDGVKLDGDVAQRMQAAAQAAADKLIDKYRWSLFTVGSDTNSPLTNLATDAMTWDSLIHTTYFDQPEVADLIAMHIAASAKQA